MQLVQKIDAEIRAIVVLKNNQLCSTSLKNVDDKSRLVATDTPALASALSMGICSGNAELTPGLHSLKHVIPGSLGTHLPRAKA
jgi:hypothetical protein